MPVSINFTERVRVMRKDAVITVGLDENEANPWFDASVELGRYRLPDDALVFVEAYRQTRRARFPFGTVSGPAALPQDQRRLSAFNSLEGILFRVKVTDPESGLILAEADSIPPARSQVSGGRSLLPVEPADLGQECWRVSFAEETGPVFMINRELPPSWREASNSREFLALVYPAVLREVLNRALRVEEYSNTEGGDYWMAPWLRFAANGLGAGKPPDADGEDREDQTFIAEVDDWIDRVVAAFCRKKGAFDKMNRED